MRYIYCITNLLNGKTYFGQRLLQEGRTFKSDLYYGSGKLIKAAQKKYGLENFKKECILIGDFTKEEINRFERCIIACQRICGKAEYNLADGGDGGCVPGGITDTSIWTHEKLSKMWHNAHEKTDWKAVSKRGFQTKKEKNYDFGQCFRGKHHTEESKKKIGLANSKNHKGSKNSQFGTHWYTNGEVNIKAKECPEGFRPGRI